MSVVVFDATTSLLHADRLAGPQWRRARLQLRVEDGVFPHPGDAVFLHLAILPEGKGDRDKDAGPTAPRGEVRQSPALLSNAARFLSGVLHRAVLMIEGQPSPSCPTKAQDGPQHKAQDGPQHGAHPKRPVATPIMAALAPSTTTFVRDSAGMERAIHNAVFEAFMQQRSDQDWSQVRTMPASIAIHLPSVLSLQILHLDGRLWMAIQAAAQEVALEQQAIAERFAPARVSRAPRS